MEPGFAKAYFRRGQAYQSIKKYKEAIDDYQYVLQNDKNTKKSSKAAAKVTRKLKMCREKFNKQKRNAKHLPKKMEEIKETTTIENEDGEEEEEEEEDSTKFRKIQIVEEDSDSDSSEDGK